ncbi:selenoprotein S [Ciona intestinalis]
MDDILEAPGDPNTAGNAGNQGPLINENPYVMMSVFNQGLAFLQAYGWFVLFGFVAVMFVWTNIEKSVKNLFGRKKAYYDDTENMTPEQVEARSVAMERARKKLQEKHDAAAREHEERLREQEEQKRLQKINDHDALKAGKTQSKTSKKLDQKPDPNQATQSHIKRNKESKPLRSSDFSPLGGGPSNSARWRPGNSRPSAGG